LPATVDYLALEVGLRRPRLVDGRGRERLSTRSRLAGGGGGGHEPTLAPPPAGAARQQLVEYARLLRISLLLHPVLQLHNTYPHHDVTTDCSGLKLVGDPTGSQIRHLLFEIHYLKQILYLTTEIRHLYVGIHRSAQFIFEYFLYALPSVLWRCWLGSRKGIRPVKNGVGVVGFWRNYLSGARCRLAYVPADATAIHCLASVKSRLVLPFWYRLTRVVLDKGPFVFYDWPFPHVCTLQIM